MLGKDILFSEGSKHSANFLKLFLNKSNRKLDTKKLKEQYGIVRTLLLSVQKLRVTTESSLRKSELI